MTRSRRSASTATLGWRRRRAARSAGSTGALAVARGRGRGAGCERHGEEVGAQALAGDRHAQGGAGELAFCADEAGRGAYLSTTQLVDATGLSDSTVKRALRDLERAQMIERHRGGRDHCRRARLLGAARTCSTS
jgi:DNA-binding transcriptional ArsR family regulator